MDKIAISSAKGGVGKTTTTYLLAKKFTYDGYKVGIFDADIYGPNIFSMFKVDSNDVKKSDGKNIFEPVVVENIQISSVELVLRNNEPAIWRGPMLSKVLIGLYNKVNWTDVDVLLFDMPPGTGDAYITVFNDLKVEKSILVCGDDSLSIEDTKKTVLFLNKYNISILGVIENMSENFSFGEDIIKSKSLSANLNDIPVIGTVPRLTKKEIYNNCLNSNKIYAYLPNFN